MPVSEKRATGSTAGTLGNRPSFAVTAGSVGASGVLDGRRQEGSVAVASVLRTPELCRLFARFRTQTERFRDEVLATAGAPFALSPEAQTQANLRIVRSIFGKWSVDLLTVLVPLGSARFRDLRRSLPGISSDALSRKLFALEQIGLVERRVGSGRPPLVEYRLTEDGLTLTRLGEPILLFLRLRRTPGVAAPPARRRRPRKPAPDGPRAR